MTSIQAGLVGGKTCRSWELKLKAIPLAGGFSCVAQSLTIALIVSTALETAEESASASMTGSAIWTAQEHGAFGSVIVGGHGIIEANSRTRCAKRAWPRQAGWAGNSRLIVA
jgi:hypothetical protein